jgi:hypothetical protein
LPIVCFSKIRWSAKDKLDREALEEIFGVLSGGLINLWFILLTSSTLLYVRLTSCTTKLDEPRVLYVCCSASWKLRGLMELSISRIPSSRLFMSCVVATCFICVHSACRSCEARIHSIQMEGVRGWTLSMQRLNAWMPFL